MSLGWCLELPGCAVLLAADDDPLQRSRLAVAEFIAWSHERSAQHADLKDESVTLAQVLETGADVAAATRQPSSSTTVSLRTVASFRRGRTPTTWLWTSSANS